MNRFRLTLRDAAGVRRDVVVDGENADDAIGNELADHNVISDHGGRGLDFGTAEVISVQDLGPVPVED